VIMLFIPVYSLGGARLTASPVVDGVPLNIIAVDVSRLRVLPT
jgi:hypothetical protein